MNSRNIINTLYFHYKNGTIQQRWKRRLSFTIEQKRQKKYLNKKEMRIYKEELFYNLGDKRIYFSWRIHRNL